MQAIFSQEYLLYFKEKWCSTAEKDPLFGHVDGFQIDPSMPDYQKLYLLLFNACTDAVRQMEQQNYGTAKDILMKTQQQAEEIYISEAEPANGRP